MSAIMGSDASLHVEAKSPAHESQQRKSLGSEKIPLTPLFCPETQHWNSGPARHFCLRRKCEVREWERVGLLGLRLRGTHGTDGLSGM